MIDYGDIILIALPDWPDYYAGSDGYIYSYKKGTYNRLSPMYNHTTGVYTVTLYNTTDKYERKINNKKHWCAKPRVKAIHILVATAWLGPKPGPSYYVVHKDRNHANNLPDNLEWDQGHGRKFSDELIREIRNLKGQMTGVATAKLYGTSSCVICRIWKRQIYKGVV